MVVVLQQCNKCSTACQPGAVTNEYVHINVMYVLHLSAVHITDTA